MCHAAAETRRRVSAFFAIADPTNHCRGGPSIRRRGLVRLSRMVLRLLAVVTRAGCRPGKHDHEQTLTGKHRPGLRWLP